MADSPSREDEQPGYLTDLELMPFDPEFRADPHPRLKRLREHCLVHRAADSDRVRVSSFAGCQAMVRDLSLGVDPRKALPDDPVRIFSSGEREPSMLFLDDPEHARLRNLVSRAFTPAVIRTPDLARSHRRSKTSSSASSRWRVCSSRAAGSDWT